MISGEIPILLASDVTLPAVWEKAVIKLWEQGAQIRTEYDKPQDPPSRDATMIMVVEEPLSEPRIHRAFPGSLEDLEIYRQEVINGIHDHWINPLEGKWTYTYHQRLFSFQANQTTINQIDYIIKKLSQHYYSRRAQAITWNPKLDPKSDDPPCLQRLWFRMVNSQGGSFLLEMNSHWRSRDAFKAAFMNMFALIDLQALVAGRLSQQLNKKVIPGRYVDISDSFHIYGNYFKEFEGFLQLVKTRDFAQRTWEIKFAEKFFNKAREKIKREKDG